MFIPFPFVHAQMSAFYTIAMVFVIPFLMLQYTDGVVIGALSTFLSVLCLAGLHEVARELENPFRNVPNDLPLCSFQAGFNETLLTMFAGYHPDAYWDKDEILLSGGRQRKNAVSLSPELVDIKDDEGDDTSLSSVETQSCSNETHLSQLSEKLGRSREEGNLCETSLGSMSSSATPDISQLRAFAEEQRRVLETLRRMAETRNQQKLQNRPSIEEAEPTMPNDLSILEI